jgi:ABC-type molybdate transport system substrate-binding protein
VSILKKIRETDDIKTLMCAFLEIKRRLTDEDLGVANSLTDPVGQYAEYLAQKVYGGKRTNNGTAGHDLIDRNKRKIEVKGRVKKHDNYKPKTYINDSNVSGGNFDYLVYVVFNNDFEVEYAFGVTQSNFKAVFNKVEHGNSPPKWVIKAREEILENPKIENITNVFRNANKSVN